MEIYKEIVCSIAAWREALANNAVEARQAIIPAISQLSQEWKEYNRLKSREFNTFDFFSPGETMHSRILAFFLNPQDSHGQGSLFLVKFLQLLGIDSPKEGRWIVTAEKGRIDVLIKRAHPHSVIIIENKSNGAVDQNSQLYRYWYQEIYQKQVERNVAPEQLAHPAKEYYRIVYLAPVSWKTPADYSLCRPSAWSEIEHLPEKIPIHPEHHLFGELVVEWLSDCLELIPESNSRMKEFVKQYIESWQ